MFRIAPLAAVIGALFAVPAVAAESAAPADATDLPRVQVTALAPSIQLNVPGTVSTIDRVQMDRHLNVSIRDLVRYEAGVSAIGTGGRFGLDSFNIRGLSGNRTRIEIDGVSMPASFGADVAGGSFRAGRNFVDLDQLKSVEIVRGPASVLYPSDALGGVVSLRTKDPADYLRDGRDTYVSLKELYDSSDRSLTSTVTLAGGDKRNGILFVGNHREGSELANQGEVGGTGAARTRPDPRSYSLDSFLGKYVHTADSGRADRIGMDGSQTRTRTNSLSNVTPAAGYYRSQDENMRVRATVGQWFPQLGSVLADTLDWNVYWQKSRTRTNTQTETATLTRYYQSLPLQEKVFGGKLVAVKQLGEGGPVTQAISYGVELSRTDAQSYAGGYGVNKRTGASGSGKPFMPGNYPLHLIPDSETDRYSAFVQDEIGLLGGKLELTPAVRVDRYSYKPQDDALYAAYNPGYVRQDYSKTHASPKLGVLWHFNGTLSAYANYAQGFRPPLYSEIAGAWNEQPFPGFNIAFLPNEKLKAETSRGLELGLRGKGEAGWFNVAAYYNRYRDFIWSGYQLKASQVPDWVQVNPGMNLFYQAVNARKAYIKGAEASGALRLAYFNEALQGWSVRGSAAVASGRLIEPGASGYSPLNTVDPAKLVLGIAYDARQWGAELIGTGVRRHSRLGDPKAFRPGGYATLDLYAHYSPLANVELYAGISNLADRKYWDWGSLNSGALGNLVTGNGINDAGTGSIPADRLTMPGRAFSVAARIAF
ncbi:TonB-dependent hemoglobin/transferrin/lactoferrin family receptor [Dyella sp. LX-66]|uniref:TonB-dependent hemoglobin/transferrin/lactoferrin family receptor n=1 Tax=unclassified Dyella TaxID=2634549 RepID=UPI001BE0392F|nr:MULTISPECIES: TonB-dependent hemoglobin/transferrin/lactoferrin family receptor [unclassified Dyella]MBT2118837.1 TonB-dependent hemoglobin/transferrin/lactoferrin family receptor [Dyella sp. LX-1]MBT2140170.1 TonB-dependent hemoglobin/transferrin/lactoferrin family receptor [Dyella sp. LX-66]